MQGKKQSQGFPCFLQKYKQVENFSKICERFSTCFTFFYNNSSYYLIRISYFLMMSAASSDVFAATSSSLNPRFSSILTRWKNAFICFLWSSVLMQQKNLTSVISPSISSIITGSFKRIKFIPTSLHPLSNPSAGNKKVH